MIDTWGDRSSCLWYACHELFLVAVLDELSLRHAYLFVGPRRKFGWSLSHLGCAVAFSARTQASPVSNCGAVRISCASIVISVSEQTRHTYVSCEAIDSLDFELYGHACLCVGACERVLAALRTKEASRSAAILLALY